MKHSEQLDKISPALLGVNKELKAIAQTAENPFYKSSYAPLNDIVDYIRPIYNKYGISILQDISETNNKITVATMLLHESGQWIIQDGLPLPTEKQTPQGAGSAVTYGRRYSVSAMGFLATEEDDDGNSHEKPKKKESKIENKIKDEFNGEEVPDMDLTPEGKLLLLPENIKEGLRILTNKNGKKAIELCEMYSWNEDKITAHLKQNLK